MFVLKLPAINSGIHYILLSVRTEENVARWSVNCYWCFVHVAERCGLWAHLGSAASRL